MSIDELIEREGFTEECMDCPFFEEWFEPRPWGSTVTYETLMDCHCKSDSDCIRLQVKGKEE